MKQIPLSTLGKHKNKHITLVDDDDYEWLNQWRWSVVLDTTTQYVQRFDTTLKKYIKMHRQIMDVLSDVNVKVDHKDHNGLNNQRFNLRIATRSQNGANRLPPKKRLSKYTGVCLINNGRQLPYWNTYIRVNGKRIYVGYFKSEMEAAIAYDNAAKKYHGEFASLNFK